MTLNIIRQSPLPLALMQEEIKRIKERDTELGFRAMKTDEYLSSLPLDEKKVRTITKALEDAQIPRLKQEHITKIVDIMPTHPDELKLILQAYTITVSPDNLKKIQALIDEYAKQ